MSATGFYEEVINFNDMKVRNTILIHVQTDEEFLKFYINEEFNDSERINYIIKKGFICQKACVSIN